MRVDTSGVRVEDGLFGARFCLLAVCVFVCSIDRSNSSGDTGAKDTIEEPICHHPSSLSDAQLNSAFTIEFDFKHIGKTNRTAMNIAYRDARRKILEKLKSRKHKASSPTTSTTVAAGTTIVSTTPPSPPPERKRKRRSSKENNSTLLTDEGNNSTLLTDEGNNSTLTDDDLPFVDNGLEIDEDGTLRISFFINTTEFSEDELWNALNELKTEEDGFKEIAPVIAVYKGLPPKKSAMADIRVWLPILFAIIALIIIFIIGYCCWKATNRKVKDVEHPKIMPKQDSKPSPSNGHALPRILDDNDGWLVPYEQFGEQK